ncbi:MAG: class I SAM-dependent methyltransferase [Planktotalea sp.]|uniref:class I SAM-dependent methyltransferase n=1 Tax=Planktotalea sp. TaxID=2029877 RepID=UPI003C7674F7
MINEATFWDKVSEKYARDPIKDMDAYTYTRERTRSYLKHEDTVLEIGCGTGSTALELADAVGAYHGTDISPNMIKIARRKVAASSIANLSFEAHPALEGIHAHEGLDAVLAFNLLHLLRDIPATLKAAHAALRPGGLLITKTACLKSASFKYQLMFKVIPLAQMLGKAPFVQFFTEQAYDSMIEAAGFEIIESGNHPVNPPARYVVARKR